MLLSCGVFAYAVGNIGQIFSDMFKKNEEFKERMSIMTTYLNRRGINYELLQSVRKYFEYIHHESDQDIIMGE